MYKSRFLAIGSLLLILLTAVNARSFSPQILSATLNSSNQPVYAAAGGYSSSSTQSTSQAPDWTLNGFPRIIASQQIPSGNAANIQAGPYTIQVPAGAFSQTVTLQVYAGNPSNWVSKAPSGETPVLAFALGAMDSSGNLIATFNKPLTLTATDPAIMPDSKYYNVDTSGALTANSTGLQASTSMLSHPLAADGVGWLITTPTSELTSSSASVADWTQHGFPNIIASQKITPGQETYLNVGPYTFQVPANAFSNPVTLQVYRGSPSKFMSNAPSGETPVLAFALGALNSQGQLIAKFNSPIQMSVKDPAILQNSKYYLVASDGTMTANTTGLVTEAGVLMHPIGADIVGWVITSPTSALNLGNSSSGSGSSTGTNSSSNTGSGSSAGSGSNSSSGSGSGSNSSSNSSSSSNSNSSSTSTPAVTDWTLNGFPTILASKVLIPGDQNSVQVGPYTFDIPSGTFGQPVIFQVYTGSLSNFMSNAPQGQQPVLDFAIGAMATGGQLIGKFNNPITLTVTDPAIASGSQYYNISAGGTFAPNPTGLKASTGSLSHPIAADTVGWVITMPASSTSSNNGSSSSSSQSATVMVSNNAKLGNILVDSQGMTLYTFKNDKANQSACNGGCASLWPPLTVAKGATPVAGSGMNGTLGVFQRADGSYQVTYNQQPLYRYSGDSQPGQTNGNGLFGGLWSVVKVTPAGSSSGSGGSGSGSSGSSSSSSGSGGY